MDPVFGSPRWNSPKSGTNSKKLDTTMRVTTPENISFEYQLAGPFRRIFAYLFDIAISLGGYFALVAMIYLGWSLVIMPIAAYLGGAAAAEGLLGILSGMIEAGWFVVLWFYGAFMEARFNGQTFGKRITKMRVITTDGHAIDGVQATLRNFFRLLDVMPAVSISAIFATELTGSSQIDPLLTAPLLPTCLFGLIAMAFSRRYQRVGDLVANTVVVNEEQKRTPNLATFFDDRVRLLAELIPKSYVVPPSMARTVAEYVDRRKHLPFQRASEIASHLAMPLLKEFKIPSDTDHDLFLCALYHRTFISEQTDEKDQVLMPGEKTLGGTTPNSTTDPDDERPNTDLELAPKDFRFHK